MLTHHYYINILTPVKLESKEEGRDILRLLTEIYLPLTPERYGTYEPLRKVYDPTNPEAALVFWGRTFLWERKKPRLIGGVWAGWGPKPMHGLISLDVETKNVDSARLVEFVSAASVQFRADFAAIHMLTPPDIATGQTTDNVFCLDPKKETFSLTITIHDLKKYIPDLYWGTVLGPAYVRHFGREHILASPAPIIRELADESIYLQLSDNPMDLETDFNRVDSVRKEVKTHLNNNSFFDVDAASTHIYNVPIFSVEGEYI